MTFDLCPLVLWFLLILSLTSSCQPRDFYPSRPSPPPPPGVMGGSFSIVPEGNDTEVTVVVVSPDGQQQQSQPSPSQFYPQPRKNYYHDPAAVPYDGSYGPHQYGQPHPGYPGYAPRPYGAPPSHPPLHPYPYGDPYMAYSYSQFPQNPYGAPQYGQPYGYPQGKPPPPPPNQYGHGPAKVPGSHQPLTFKLVGLNQSQAHAQSTTVVTPTPPAPSDNARSASAIGDKIANQVWEKIQKKQQQQKQQMEAASGSKPPASASGTPGSNVSKMPLGPPSPSAILKVNRPTATTSSSTKSFDNVSNTYKMGPQVTPPNTDYVPGAMFSIADLAKINDSPKCGTQKSARPNPTFSNSKVQEPPSPNATTLQMVANYKKSQVSAERSKSAIGSGYRTSVRSPDASKVENSGVEGSSKSKRPKSLAMGSSKKPRSASGRSSSTPSSHSETSSTKSSNVEGSTKSTTGTSGTEASTRKQKAKQLDRAKAKATAGKLGTKNTKTKKPPTIDSTFFALPKSTTDVGCATMATSSKGPHSGSTGIPGSSIGCTPSSVGPSERPFPSAQTPSSGIGDSSNSSSSSSTSKTSKPKSVIAGSKKPSSRTSIRNERPQSVTSVRSNKSLKSIDKKVPAPSVGRWSSISSTSFTSSNTDKPKSLSDDSNSSSSTPVSNPDSKKRDYNEKNKREGEIEARKSSDPDDKKDDDHDGEEKKAKMKQKEADAKKDSTKKRQDPDEC